MISLLICTSYLSAETVVGSIKVVALRVSFQTDDSPGTTGDGNFLLIPDTSVCGKYTIDRPPHNKSYFESHLIAIDNYFGVVSDDNFGLNIDESKVVPEGDTNSYKLPHTMSYYNPYGASDEVKDSLIIELFRDAIEAAYSADTTIDFPFYDLVVVFHAGIGQDFSLPFLDPTPEDIPSTYIDRDMLGDPIYGVEHGIILPETQNLLLFEEAEDIFSEPSESCDFQYGLTGTFALMVGFAVGLPPLWNTDSGESGVGVFGLMDQGSNNGRGLIPAPPVAWTRIYAGWVSPEIMKPTRLVSLPSMSIHDTIIQVFVDDDEYFLVENRNNWYKDNVSIDSIRYAIWEKHKYKPGLKPSFFEILFDSVNVIPDEHGVVNSIPNYDLGLPASGLLIWHIDESVINAGINDYSINGNRERHGVDLEEADGAQDIGYPSIFLFADPSTGYFGDMWFKGNLEYEAINGEGNPQFGPYTYPDTRSNDEASTFLSIENISSPGDTMSFIITSDLLADGFPDTMLHIRLLEDLTDDGIPELIGGGDSLWWSPMDSIYRRSFYRIPDVESYELVVSNNNADFPTLAFVGDVGDSILVVTFKNFEQSWLQWVPTESFLYVKGFQMIDQFDLFSTNNWWHINEDSVGIYGGDVVPYTPDKELIITNTIIDSTLIITLLGDQFWINRSQFVTIGDTYFLNHSAVDLDLDGIGEIILVSEAGDVYVFNQNFTLLPGFPVSINANSTVLARNLFNDEHPELIIQLESGEISILNWRGEEVYRLANPKNSQLRMVADYQGRSSVISESTIWKFDSIGETNGNEWAMSNANQLNIRELNLNIPIRIVDDTKLIDKKRTYSYPNPAREGKVIFRIFVESAEKVDITIYDLAGYFITELVMDNPIQGEVNEVSWDVSKVESGVYFANVTASMSNREETKILKIGVIH